MESLEDEIARIFTHLLEQSVEFDESIRNEIHKNLWEMYG